MPYEPIITIVIAVLAVVVLSIAFLIIRYVLTGESIANPVCKVVIGWLDPALWTLFGEYLLKPLFGSYPRPSELICNLAVPY